MLKLPLLLAAIPVALAILAVTGAISVGICVPKVGCVKADGGQTTTVSSDGRVVLRP